MSPTTAPTTWPTTWPTLADVPRAEWPDGLRIVQPDPFVRGAVVQVQCAGTNCLRVVPAEEMLDLRAIPAARRAELGLDARCGPDGLMCAACLGLCISHGHALSGDVARELGLHPDTCAALDFSDAHGTQRGHIVTTDRTRHLHAVKLDGGRVATPTPTPTPTAESIPITRGQP